MASIRQVAVSVAVSVFATAFHAADASQGIVQFKLKGSSASVARSTKDEKSTLTCSSNHERCLVPIYVGLADDGECFVNYVIGTIYVPKSTIYGKKIKVVWIIQKMNSDDTKKYGFHKDHGIRFVDANNTPYIPNARDFDSPGRDHNDEGSAPVSRRFKWRSVNEGTPDVDFSYQINVAMNPGTASEKACKVIDPKIVNTN